MRQADDIGDRGDRAERVRNVGDRYQLGSRGQEISEALEKEVSLVIDRRHLQHDLFFVAQQLPGHDVRVVLELRKDDLVAGLQHLAAERRSHEVDRLRCSPDEDDLGRAPGIDKVGDLAARRFERLGRSLAQRVDATVHIRVVQFIRVSHRIQDKARLLSARGIVQIDEAPAVHGLRKDGEIIPQPPALDGVPTLIAGQPLDGKRCGAHRACSRAAANHLPAAPSIASLTSSTDISSKASERNASISRRRAASSGRPRARR